MESFQVIDVMSLQEEKEREGQEKGGCWFTEGIFGILFFLVY